MKIQNVLNKALMAGVGGLAVAKGVRAAPAGDHFEVAKRSAAPGPFPAPAPDAPLAWSKDRDCHENNILIADQFNNRIIEIDPKGHILWQFGNGSSVAGPHSVVGPNDAERINHEHTLIAGTGAPQNTEPTCTGADGCPDNRVIIVNDASGKIIWQYGQDGVAGSGPNQLNTPVAATILPNGNILITDQGNQQIIEVRQSDKAVVWRYGTTGQAATACGQPNLLNSPNSAERLPNGHTLIADEADNCVIEIDAQQKVVWQYPQTPDTSKLNGAAFASRLPNGNTLITDSGNNRIIEVRPSGDVVWSYVTNERPGSNPNPLPTRGVRLANGNTLISDQFNQQVIEVNPAGNIVFTYGQINMAGNGPNQLNAPYDAKVVGDFTGLTPPPGGHQS